MICLIAVLVLSASAHDYDFPINPQLGIPGFPDCYQPNLHRPDFDPSDVVTNAETLECYQKPKDRASQISIGCVGDSITAGVHSSGGNHTYPGQLQILLGDNYKVTNLGACGSTMQKHANNPYWKRKQFKTLTENKWDIIIIMLGTNDAKDPGDHGANNWPHNCTGSGENTCPFSVDYKSMIDLIRTLGTKPSGPEIYLAIPPPLMKDGVYGMNGTVINRVFPVLIPAINHYNDIPTTPIDIFLALGGADLPNFPPGGCTLNNPNVADCKLYCDHQSCDQCHPNNDGYHVMAQAMKKGLGL